MTKSTGTSENELILIVCSQCGALINGVEVREKITSDDTKYNSLKGRYSICQECSLKNFPQDYP